MPYYLSPTQKAYLAGFLDGDGSIYVRLKPNPTYKYGFQVATYAVLFQSAKNKDNFKKICNLIKLGYIRKRKDGILEYIINRKDSLHLFLKIIKPYSILKKKQIELMIKILDKKEMVKNKRDFKNLVKIIKRFKDLNYSKRYMRHISTP